MEGVAAKEGVVFLRFEAALLQFFIAAGEITGGGFALRFGFGAFKNNVFAHKGVLFKRVKNA